MERRWNGYLPPIDLAGIGDTTLRLHLEDPARLSCETEAILRIIETSTTLLCAAPPLTDKIQSSWTVHQTLVVMPHQETRLTDDPRLRRYFINQHRSGL